MPLLAYSVKSVPGDHTTLRRTQSLLGSVGHVDRCSSLLARTKAQEAGTRNQASQYKILAGENVPGVFQKFGSVRSPIERQARTGRAATLMQGAC